MSILIIKEEFGELILQNKKKWEIRGTNTKKRERIKIACSKTGLIFGEVDLVDSFPLTKNYSMKTQININQSANSKTLVIRIHTFGF